MVSRSWRQLTPEDRVPWDEMARKDRARFELEKSLYDGPWKVPDVKDPYAPKRPVSAFLLFSKAKRDLVKREGRFRTTTEISTVLSKMWREAPAEERQAYLDRDMEDRKRYKRELLEYERVASKGRFEREALAAKVIEEETSSRQADDEELSIAWAATSEKSPEVRARDLETKSPGLSFAEEWGRAQPEETSSAMAGNDPTAQLNQYVDAKTKVPRQVTSPNFDTINLPPLKDPFSKEINETAPVPKKRDLFDTFTRASNVTGEGTFHFPWDPIPWDAPVAEFDHCSDGSEDFAISPLATRSIMMDHSTGVVTPPDHLVSQHSYVGPDKQHQLPFNHQQTRWYNQQVRREQHSFQQYKKRDTSHHQNEDASKYECYNSALKQAYGNERDIGDAFYSI